MKPFEKRFTDYRRINKGHHDNYIETKLNNLPISKEIKQIDKSNLLESSDYNSLYPSAMAHLNSK